MVESVAKTEEKSAQPDDLETIRDKLVAVKQAIALIEDPAGLQSLEETVESTPKALSKNEKRRLAK